MSVKHWLVGCALCFASIGGAAATSVEGRDLDTAAHGSSDANTAHDAGVSDLQGTARENGTRGHAGDGSKTTSSAGDRSSIESSPSLRIPPSHLGWQSLLPGSIQ